MTHAEATANDRKGFASTCPGELKSLGTYPDDYLDPGTGRVARRAVTLFGCECRCDLAVTEAGVVLNVYRRPEPARIAAGLAARLDAGRGGTDTKGED